MKITLVCADNAAFAELFSHDHQGSVRQVHLRDLQAPAAPRYPPESWSQAGFGREIELAFVVVASCSPVSVQPTKPASVNARKKGESPESGATGATAGAGGRPWRCLPNWTKSSTSARKLSGSVAISLSIILNVLITHSFQARPLTGPSPQYVSNGRQAFAIDDSRFHGSVICGHAFDATKREPSKLLSNV